MNEPKNRIIRSKSLLKLLPLFLTLLLMLVISNCSSDIKKIENPNSKEYKKIEVTQETKEIEKIRTNKVKERRTYSKFTTNYIPSGGREVLAEKIHFDENGNKLEQVRYRADGVDMQTLYNYDEFGNFKTIENYDGYQNLITRTNFDYTSEGILLKRVIEKNNNKTYFEYEYDNKYNLTRFNTYNNNHALFEYSLYKYEKDYLDSLIVYSNGYVTKISIFNYDSLNRLINENSIVNKYYNDITIYEYDKEGNFSKVSNPKTMTWEYKYDQKGNILEEISTDKDGNLQTRFTYDYNKENSLLSSKLRYDGNNVEALEIRYEYDFY